MSSADSYAQFIPKNEEDTTSKSAKAALETLMVDNMIKDLTRDDTWNRMRQLMETHMEEVDWERQVEARMEAVVGNSDIDKRPYIEMLKELGGDELEEKLRAETDPTKLNDVDYLVEQLVKLDRFAMSQDMKTRLFPMFEIVEEARLNAAYNSAREKVRLDAAKANQL